MALDETLLEDVPPLRHLAAEFQILIGKQDRHLRFLNFPDDLQQVPHDQRRQAFDRLVQEFVESEYLVEAQKRVAELKAAVAPKAP